METMGNFWVYRRVWPSVWPIILRNVLVLVNVVIGAVVVLLFIFGSAEAALFLGIVFFLNTVIAIVQDIHARVLLERLQMLTALKVVRLNKDGRQTLVLAEQIIKGDKVLLKLGDQAPCEGKLISADNLEISEALVTGESESFPKKAGDEIMAGAVVTSGFAVMEAKGFFKDSRLSIIAEEVKKYAANPSSIQTSINTIIKYSSYALAAVLVFVVARGMLLHLPDIQIVTNAGALASTMIPQGLVVLITLLFAVGAASYAKKNVLFQEINATEKLGRIKNLCIDKTGTLTDNILVVDDVCLFGGLSDAEVRPFLNSYFYNAKDSSQTFLAVRTYLEKSGRNNFESNGIEITGAFSFSSWRRYGAVEIIKDGVPQTIFAGAPDVFSAATLNPEEKKWLQDITEENTRAGNRVLCLARVNGTGFSKDLSDARFSILAVIVFRNTLRQGIQNAIKFFQNRGIRIRVISGDSQNTVRAVAQSVGIFGADKVITGEIIKGWSDADYAKNLHSYSVFAQILPEQKVRLVQEFKKDGFTAMVGDGVNDALAMKKADFGIAMFDGVPVTRQLADVILMSNSFSDLPGAIELADHFIRSIEINSGVYINMSLAGFLFFVFISPFGFSYPLTPLNITFINYFTVGFSSVLISYWALRPSRKILPADHRPFLKRIIPLSFYCAVIEAAGMAAVHFFSPSYLQTAASNSLVVAAYILFGYLFLLFGARVYCDNLNKNEKNQLLWLGVFQLVVLIAALQIPFIIRFFNITLPYPSFGFSVKAFLIVVIFALVEYLIVKKFFLKETEKIAEYKPL